MAEDKIVKQNEADKTSIEKSKSFNFLLRIFYIGGIIGILFGFINLYGGLSSEFSGTQLEDTIFNSIFGILFLICGNLLSKSKFLVTWVFMGAIILSIVYSYVLGRGFNFIIAIIGAWIIWQLFKLRKQNEIL
ncbi:MAG: hypothetical protein KF758_17670 [Anaerolineales bacterium]|nr:hypothetical protein [Anaerolineales bacterium]